MTTGAIELPKLKGTILPNGVEILEEPTPIPGTNKLHALANVGGALCLVELSIKFKEFKEPTK